MAALEKHPDLRLQQNNPSGKESPFFKALLLLDPVAVSLRRHVALRRVLYQKLSIKKPLSYACKIKQLHGYARVENPLIMNLSLE